MDPAHSIPLPLALLLLFGAAKLLAELFEWLKQPAIVGEILAGVVLGPSLLGWIQPNETLGVLADLGVLFLLFQVGLEIRASELLKVGGIATLVAMIGVVVPFFAGWGILRMWGAPQAESIFLGAALVATSVGITASALSQRGLLHEAASKIILAAAVIDDVLGLLVLATVSSVAKGSLNLAEIATTATLAIGFTVVLALWGTKAVNRILPRWAATARAEEARFQFSLVLMFALSALAMVVGVAAIIGAFLAGMALSESAGEREHQLTRGIGEFLTPFFLAGIGLKLDLAVFRDGSTLTLALVILLAAIVSKLLGCGLGAAKLGAREAFKVGAGMVPRGEVGMVVAQLGLSLGIIDSTIYGVVVFMAVLTTLLAPPLLQIAFRGAAKS